MPPEAFTAAVRISTIIKAVIAYCGDLAAPSQQRAVVLVAVQNFHFQLIKSLSMSLLHYPPTKILFPDVITSINMSLIASDSSQVERVLMTLLEPGIAIDLLLPAFNPNLCPRSFVQLYQTAVLSHLTVGPEATLSIVKKFDYLDWMRNSEPLFSERSHSSCFSRMF
jgi:hypothetical protein